MDELPSRFLDGFNVIEDWMRHTLDARESDEFGSLLRRMEGSNAEIRRHCSELKRLTRLRNLIVHSHSHDKPLAVPTPFSVERIEAIGKLLLSPPSLYSFAAKPVEQCRLSDPLGCCVKKMHDKDFSQVPICDDGRYCGLLTAETIARWLAASFVGEGMGIVEEQAVAEVMKHQKDGGNVDFMPRTATVANALAAFDKFLHDGKRLEAIIITNSGGRTEKLLGIVTVYDIPKLNNAISGRPCE